MAGFGSFIGFNVQRPNYDVSALGDGFESLGQRLRERRAEDEQREIGRLLSGNDLKGAANYALKTGNIRTGLALRDRGRVQSERAAKQASAQQAARQKAAAQEQKVTAERDAKARKYVQQNLLTLDPAAHDFKQQWTGHLERLRTAGYPVPAEYDDPQHGYKMLHMEVLGAKGYISREDKRREAEAKAGNGGQGNGAEGQQTIEGMIQAGYGLDEKGNIVAAAPPPPKEDEHFSVSKVAGSSKTASPPATYGSTGGVEFGPKGQTPTDIPGVVVVPKSGASDKLATEEANHQRAVQGATQEQQARLQKVMQNQEFWRKALGKPPSGMIYNEDGKLIDLREGSVLQSRSQTQRASRGAIEFALQTFDDAEEVLRKNSFISRGAKLAANSGDWARIQGPLGQATRAIMHGMSGAQVNIPETEFYFQTFMPHWSERADTIQFKIDHMRGMMESIKQAMEGGKDIALENKIRNNMRRGLGLDPLPDVVREEKDPLTGKKKRMRHRDRGSTWSDGTLTYERIE